MFGIVDEIAKMKVLCWQARIVGDVRDLLISHFRFLKLQLIDFRALVDFEGS